MGTLLHISDAPLFRADAAVLRAVGDEASLVALPTKLASALLSRLPLGTLTLRSALLGALSAGVVALLITLASRALFLRSRDGGRLDRWLALTAGLSVVMCLPWMTETSLAAGGASLGAALGAVLLTWMVARGRRTSENFWSYLGLGTAFGFLILESVWAAGAVLISLSIAWPRPRARLRLLGVPLGAILAFGVTLAYQLAVRGQEALTLLEGATLARLIVLPDNSFVPLTQPLGYAENVGLLWSLGALVALGSGRAQRRPIYALGALLVVDLLVPMAPADSWLSAVETSHPRQVLHLLALFTIGPLGAFGLRALTRAAARLNLVGSRHTAALLTVLALTAAVAGIEDSHRILDRTDLTGPRIWTSVALDPLPSGAVVLTHSAVVSRRLTAAQAQGERPDVLIVPLDRLARGVLVQKWLDAEPALEMLIRDLSLTSSPSEHALSLLSDKRPLFVEIDPSWDSRLLEHLEPSVPLARFSASALGRSDRKLALAQTELTLKELGAATEAGLFPDLATRSVVEESVKNVAAQLQAVGDTRYAAELESASKAALDPRGVSAKAAEPETPTASNAPAASKQPG